MLELCSDGQQPVRRHVLLPSHPSSLPDEDIEYLKRKGAFSVPRSETCKSLLRAYFHHIHPLMPVVDAASIMPLLADGQATKFNLLLLWSIFFSAVTVGICDMCIVSGANKCHLAVRTSINLAERKLLFLERDEGRNVHTR